jgi:hypothetical protein
LAADSIPLVDEAGSDSTGAVVDFAGTAIASLGDAGPTAGLGLMGLGGAFKRCSGSMLGMELAALGVGLFGSNVDSTSTGGFNTRFVRGAASLAIATVSGRAATGSGARGCTAGDAPSLVTLS